MSVGPPWTESDIPALVRMPKLVVFPFPKAQKKPQHPSWSSIHAPVLYEDRSIIPGMEIVIEWKRESAQTRGNEHYMLCAMIGEDFTPIFRLEVYPAWKRSHQNMQGPHIYGPHIHHEGKIRPVRVGYACGEEHRWRWLDRFLRHIHARIIYSKQGGLFDYRSVPPFS